MRLPVHPYQPQKHTNCLTSEQNLSLLLLNLVILESPSRGSTGCYLFTVSNSGLLSVQRQPVTDTASVTDTCGFVNSIDDDNNTNDQIIWP